MWATFPLSQLMLGCGVVMVMHYPFIIKLFCSLASYAEKLKTTEKLYLHFTGNTFFKELIYFLDLEHLGFRTSHKCPRQDYVFISFNSLLDFNPTVGTFEIELQQTV